MFSIYLRYWPMLFLTVSVVLTVVGCGDGHQHHH